jgi:glycoprotein-N-acetylgalactosamine 3-beta-galactosyltransferase
MVRYELPTLQSKNVQQNDNYEAINSLHVGLSCQATTFIDSNILIGVMDLARSYDEDMAAKGQPHLSPYSDEDAIILKFHIQARISFFRYAEYSKLVYYFYALENNIPIHDVDQNNANVILTSLVLVFNFGDVLHFQLPCGSSKWMYEHGENSINLSDNVNYKDSIRVSIEKSSFATDALQDNPEQNTIDLEAAGRVHEREPEIVKGFQAMDEQNPYLKVRSADNSFIYFETIYSFGIPRNAELPRDMELPFKVHLRWHDKILEKYMDPNNNHQFDEKIQQSEEFIALQRLIKTFSMAIDSLTLSHVVPATKIDLEQRNFLSNPNSVLLNPRVLVKPQDEFSDPCRLFGTSSAVLLNNLRISNILYNYLANLQNEHNSDHIMSMNGDSEGLDTVTPVRSMPRVFCGIFTTKEKHATNIAFMKKSWGHKCTGFLVFSTIEDLSIPAIVVDHFGEEVYDNMWQKSVSIWKHIYKHYHGDYDWFLLGGDDMYVIMENLYEYLDSEEIRSAQHTNNGMYLGLSFTNPKNTTYNSGGPGYLLDQKALDILIQSWRKGECDAFKKESAEDLMLGLCLRDNSIQQILPYNTSDEFNRHRFHLFEPGFLFTYDPEGLPPDITNYWQVNYDLELRGRVGLDCCSTKSISFHDITFDGLKRIHDFLFQCPLSRKNEYFETFGKLFFNDTLHLSSWGKRTGIAFNVTYSGNATHTLKLS